MATQKKKLIILLASSVFVSIVTAVTFFTVPEKVVEDQNEQKSEEIKRIRVNLEIIDGYGEPVRVSTKLDEGSRMYDLMEKLREDGKIKYEITGYVDGEEVDSINGLDLNKQLGLGWNLYTGGQMLSKNIKSIILEKDKTYSWVYGKISK